MAAQSPSISKAIRPAKLLSVNNWFNPKGVQDPEFWIIEAKFLASLDHDLLYPEKGDFDRFEIVLDAKIVLGTKQQQRPLTVEQLPHLISRNKKSKLRVYLCGGPGEENPPDRIPELNRHYLGKGFEDCIVYPDYRGTGQSVEIRGCDGKPDPDCTKFMRLLRPQDHPNNTDTDLTNDEVVSMTRLLTLFRQDYIVRDLEAIRQCLLISGLRNNKWDLVGQSFGGWISLSYLSYYPEGINTSSITAGLAPIGKSPDEIYSALFKVVRERNEEYYAEYPEDIERVKAIVIHLIAGSSRHEAGFPLPSGGRLGPRRFLCIGRLLGSRPRWKDLHRLIDVMDNDFSTAGRLTDTTLRLYEEIDTWRLDKRPLYYLLHEAMYCRKGETSNWSASRVALKFPAFRWAQHNSTWEMELIHTCSLLEHDGKVYFSGEMVYPFLMYEYKSLRPLEKVAEALAAHKWTFDPYHDTLMHNKINVAALSYLGDMHVHTPFAEDTAGMVAGMEHEVLDKSSDGLLLEHGAIRSQPLDILPKIHKLTWRWYTKRNS